MAAICACLLVVLVSLLALLEFSLSLAEIIMGAKHLNDCPVQRLIPIYLVVAGCVGIFLGTNNGVKAKVMRANGGETAEPKEQSSTSRGLNGVISLFSLFSFIWFICGMVWIFGAKPTFEPMNAASNTTSQAIITTTLSVGSTSASVQSPINTFCYEPLYKFAMAMVIVRLALIILNIFVICCACCGAMICGVCFMSQDHGEQVPQQEEPHKQTIGGTAA